MNEVTEEKQSIENEKHNRKLYLLPEKKFEIRESRLTILSEDSNLQVLKNIFFASLLWLVTTTCVHECYHNRNILPGFIVIASGFNKIHLVALLWIVGNLIAICCYYCFVWWANIRIRLVPKSKLLNIWDTGFMIISIFYYIIQLAGTSMTVNYLHITNASAMVACTEQVRLLMKTHAFLRTNYKKVQSYKTHSDQHLEIAPLKHFAYFLLAPTMIYRDEYPRTKSIRWKFVGYRLLEFTVLIFFYALILETFIIPSVKDIGTNQSHSLLKIFLIMCNNAIVGLLFMLASFYIILHTTQNFFAELLRFGDREFYRDWWKSTNYASFFRKWNLVVSDWLYTYIYKEFYENIMPGNKFIAKTMVFVISAVIHEWILTHMIGFFFPALLIIFLFTSSVIISLELPNKELSNIFMWSLLAIGPGWLLTLYMMEYYARFNMQLDENLTKYSLISRLLQIIE